MGHDRSPPIDRPQTTDTPIQTRALQDNPVDTKGKKGKKGKKVKGPAEKKKKKGWFGGGKAKPADQNRPGHGAGVSPLEVQRQDFPDSPKSVAE